MDPKKLFAKAVQQASSCIQHIKEDQLGNPTPCTEWDLRALLNHMVYELLWVPEIVRGKTIAEVGTKYDGDILHSDFKSAWQHAADAALVAVNQAGMEAIAHLSYADVPMADYINEVGGDIFIHTWDVDQAISCTLILDEAVAKVIYDTMLPRKEELKNSGSYGTPQEIGDDATVAEKLLVLSGRSPKWQDS